MSELADQLTPTQQPLQWLQGTVNDINGDLLTIGYGDGEIQDVAKLDSYTPVIGDRVHMISQNLVGILVLGTSASLNPPPSFDTPEDPVIVNSLQVATYGPTAEAWAVGVLEQEPGRTIAWFYDPVEFEPLALWDLASVELEITKLTGGPTELVLLEDVVPAGNITRAVEQSFPVTMQIPLAVPTWVPVPIEWGIMLANAQAYSIGLTSELFLATYSGTGRLRFTQI
jgi:hypothetical protein